MFEYAFLPRVLNKDMFWSVSCLNNLIFYKMQLNVLFMVINGFIFFKHPKVINYHINDVK